MDVDPHQVESALVERISALNEESVAARGIAGAPLGQQKIDRDRDQRKSRFCHLVFHSAWLKTTPNVHTATILVLKLLLNRAKKAKVSGRP